MISHSGHSSSLKIQEVKRFSVFSPLTSSSSSKSVTVGFLLLSETIKYLDDWGRTRVPHLGPSLCSPPNSQMEEVSSSPPHSLLHRTIIKCEHSGAILTLLHLKDLVFVTRIVIINPANRRLLFQVTILSSANITFHLVCPRWKG